MQTVYSAIFILAGSLFLVRNLWMLVSEVRLHAYLEKSPKSKLWVNKLGMEKAIQLSKTVFIPLGIAVSAAMVGVGVYGLISW